MRNPAIFAALRVPEAATSSVPSSVPSSTPALSGGAGEGVSPLSSIQHILSQVPPLPPLPPSPGVCTERNDRQAPALYSLFVQYCELSERYREAGGWTGFGK